MYNNYDQINFWRNNKDIPRRQSGTRKIADPPVLQPCRHPAHKPPNMCVFEPGMYEHICPGCGNKIIFTVSGSFM